MSQSEELNGLAQMSMATADEGLDRMEQLERNFERARILDENDNVFVIRSTKLPDESLCEIMQFLDRFTLDIIEMSNYRFYSLVYEKENELAARVIGSAELRCIVFDEVTFIAKLVSLNDDVADAFNVFDLCDADFGLVATEFMRRLHSCVVTADFTIGGQQLERWIGPMARYMEDCRAIGWHCIITGSLELPGSVVNADATEIRLLCKAFEHVGTLRTRHPHAGAMEVCREEGIPYAVSAADAHQILDYLFNGRHAPSKELTLCVGDLKGDGDIVGMLVQRHNTESNDIVVDLQIRFMDPLPLLAEYDEKKSGSVYRFTNGDGATLIVEPADCGLRAVRKVEL